MFRITLSVIGSCCLIFGGGCNLAQAINPMGMAMEEAASGLVRMVEDQCVLKDFSGNIDGNVFNPGVVSESCFSTKIRLTGVQGSVDLSGRGTGTKLPAGLREALVGQLDGPISDAQRESILTILGWNRLESPQNPVLD